MPDVKPLKSVIDPAHQLIKERDVEGHEEGENPQTVCWDERIFERVFIDE